MAIHHATAKRAADNAIALDEGADGSIVATSKGADGRWTHHSNAKIALNLAILAQRFGLEYDVEIRVAGDLYATETLDGTPIATFDPEDFDIDAVFAETLAAAQEEGLNIEAEEVDLGSIVAPRYKARYAERGDATHCGDWLAKWLKGRFNGVARGTDGKEVTTFDVDAFLAFVAENGIDVSAKWAVQQRSNGWQGRVRMGGRNALVKAIKTNRAFVYQGEDLSGLIPAEFLPTVDEA